MKPKVQKKSSTTLKKPSKRHKAEHGQIHPIVKELEQVPYQKPILKEEYNDKRYRDNFRKHPINPERASKYVGVSYDVVVNKWRAQMMIQGKVVNLGCYVDEEEAGSMYAKAAYRFKSRTPNVGIYGGLDLRAVPNQPLILRPDHETATIKYKGLKLCKGRWQARISAKCDRCHHLGTFDTMEEAAQIYANAAYYLEHKNDSYQKAVEIVEEHFRCPV